MKPGIDPVVVRRMSADEYPALREVSVAAFDGDPQIGTLLDTLRRSWAWEDELSFVAVRDGEIIGHVLYTHAYVDAPDRLVDVLVLAPLGVHPDAQQRGIGELLVTGSLRQLANRPEPLVFVEGHPRYYPRFGFRRASELGFTPPSVRSPDDAFMVLPLAGYEPGMTGALVYPDAFWRTDSVGLRNGT